MWLLAISAKRYTFFRVTTDGEVGIIGPSEHGLGHLLNPYGSTAKGTAEDEEEEEDDDTAKSWIREVWETVVRRTLGLPDTRLSFGDLPAVTRTSITTPHVIRNLSDKDWGDASDGEMRPATFLLSVAVAPFGHPEGVDPKRFHLFSPFSSSPAKWLDGPWVDVHSGREFPVTTDSADLDPECVHVKTFADVVEEFAVHPEPKSAGSDGEVCNRATRGLLKRRHVRATTIVHTGKESNRLEDVRKGLVHDWDEIATTFEDPAYDEWPMVLREVHLRIGAAELARIVNRSERTVRNWTSQRSRPNDAVVVKLRELLNYR